MHTTAHPDDEHGGVIAWLSRVDGARVALMTLNRGESGDNAIGPQLFDGLGLIRTEELRRRRPVLRRRRAVLHDASSTTASRSGSKKRSTSGAARTCCAMSCASSAWSGRWCCCRASRATQRDGHGNHQTAGLADAAGVSRPPAIRNSFPEQIAEGLRPWQPLKVYIGGVRDNEDWTRAHRQRRVQPVARGFVRQLRAHRLELPAIAEQRPLHAAPGPNFGYYKRVGERARRCAGEGSERSWTGIDTTSCRACSRRCGRSRAGGREAQLAAIDARRRAARCATSRMTDPSAVGAGAGRKA